MIETFYAEAIDVQGRRVEYGPFKGSARLPKALQSAKRLVQQGFHGAVVVGYEQRDGLIRESRVLNVRGDDISRAHWLRQKGSRT